MLELIRDNRSSDRLEIVIFTLNEEQRISCLLRYYSGRFDIVLLDDGSSDKTVEIAIRAGATVFRRIGQEVGERYLVYYVNEATKSNLCFYLFADEFIAKSDLEAIEAELREHAAAILCSKAEWVYGRQMLTLNHTEPRGFRRGCIRYVERLHENLQAIALPGAPVCPRLFPLHHLHVWSVESYFGKIGVYSRIEIEQFHQAGHPLRRFLRRYAASLIGFPLTKVWRERGIGLPRALFWMLFDLTELVIAALGWIERAYLMSPQDQLDLYSHFYSDEKLAPSAKDKMS